MPSHGDKQDQFQASWLSQMPVALTVLDLEGRLLFYNDHAPSLLNRRPEHLGLPVQGHHQQQASVDKIEAILAGYRAGQRREHAWLFQRQGRTFAIRVAPWVVDGQLKGLLHTAAPLPESSASTV
jgi:DUF438 domain-containing protein